MSMPAAMPALTLYGTPGCHLCDVAESLLAPLSGARGLSVQYIDIALDGALVARYGELIPVLCSSTGDELRWPFSLLDALKLVQR
ncbi:MAG: glutaredoxin family protein [Pseudomonadota bacterium]